MLRYSDWLTRYGVIERWLEWGNQDRSIPLHPTGRQWFPNRGSDILIEAFPPTLAHFSGGCGFKLQSCLKFFTQKILAKGQNPTSYPKSFLQVFLPHNFLSPTLNSSFLLFFFLLNLMVKLCMSTFRLFCPRQRLVLGRMHLLSTLIMYLQ